MTTPGPRRLPDDVELDDDEGAPMFDDDDRAGPHTSPLPGPVEAVGGVDHLAPHLPTDAELEAADHAERLDRWHAYERLIIRILSYALYVFGIVWTASAIDNPLIAGAVLILGGLVPSVLLLAREQEERRIEEARHDNRPERRVGGMPPLRGPAQHDDRF